VFIYGGDTYAYVETTGATGTYQAADFVVKLTGTPLAAGTFSDKVLERQFMNSLLCTSRAWCSTRMMSTPDGSGR